MNTNKPNQLVRAVTLPGAIMMGMGSIVGTGVFVSLGLAAGLAGTASVLALLMAGCLAICNGLSSAQLAASHPVSGGTYEYANRYIHPWPGFLAGWLFICAKSASAATAAIGFGGYFVHLFGMEFLAPWQIGLIAVVILTLICLMGIHRTSMANTVIVSITLLTLSAFVIFLSPDIEPANFSPTSPNSKPFAMSDFLEASALMFVAYTGYGRIATLGDEIANPIKNIPKAIVITLALSFVLYISVAFTAIGVAGANGFYRATVVQAAPLEVIAYLSDHPVLAKILAVGAMTAMLGVLLNLVLGVSRVVYAMAKKNDLPPALADIASSTRVPYLSVVVTGATVFSLVFLKDVKSTWSFSAFTVLFYYALTNASALRLPAANRLYPRLFAWLGLFGCLGLSFWVEQDALLLGLALLVVGIGWRLLFRACRARA